MDRELYIILDHLERISTGDPAPLKKNVYEFLSRFSFLVLEAKKTHYKKGWLSKIKDRHGDSLFDKPDSEFIEVMLNKQVSGGSRTQLIKHIESYLSIVHNDLHQISRELETFSYVRNNPLRLDLSVAVPIPEKPYAMRVTIVSDPIPLLVRILIESIRISYDVGRFSSDMTRNIIVLLVGCSNILNGEWKQGLLGVYQALYDEPEIIDILSRVSMSLLDFSLPEIHDILNKYKDYTYIFGLLFGFATLASDVDRQIIRESLNSSEDIGLNDIPKLQTLQETNVPIVDLIAQYLREITTV